MHSPGEAIRQEVSDLDLSLPGSHFRKASYLKLAELVDLFWEEVSLNTKVQSVEEYEDLDSMARMTMARVLSLLLTGTIALYPDSESASDAEVTLAILVAACEEQFGLDMIPMREVVDAVYEAIDDA